MEIKKINAESVKDSRGEKTIQIVVRTSKGRFVASSPSGKSKGKFEVKSYAKSLDGDISYINNLDVERINGLGIDSFEDLKYIETMVFRDIGGNSLFALEASILKALAAERGKELWEFLSEKEIRKINIRPVGNAIGGGLHSCGVKGRKPDFQEFLFIPNCKRFSDCIKINKRVYRLAKKLLKARKRNDEGAWETNLSNQQVLIIMKNIQKKIKEKYGKKVDIGVDVAASSFYKNGHYIYKNPKEKKDKENNLEYISNLVNAFGLHYIEDPLDENDFLGFREMSKRMRGRCLIVGDDLIATNPARLKNAIKMKSVNAVVVKPNQIGSLLEVKEVVNICKKNRIKTVMSHRSGETKDDTIADLAVGFECDFFKAGIYGKVRKSKLNRIIEIERKILS